MKKMRYLLIAGGVSLASLTVATQASAQAADADNSTDEIIVTANKREQNVQDVGIAVSALGSDRLESISKQDISALTRALPAVQIQSIGFTGIAAFNIRGISQNDYAPHQESPIAFYSDGAYMANMAIGATEFYDLERLEVLRGPQGTLFGRNATGGLIQIYSKKPTKELDGYLTLTAGNFGTFVGEGAVGGPITDHIRARLSVQTKQGGAYVKNLTGRDLGADHFYAGRLQLAFDIGSSGELLLKAETSRDENGTGTATGIHEPATPDALGQGVFTSRNYNFTVSYPDIAEFDRRVTNLTANYSQEIGSVQLTSISNYVDLHKFTLAPDPVILPDVSAGTKQHQWQVSQELRLADNDGRFRWTLGGYFLQLESYNEGPLQISAIPGLGLPDVNIIYTARSRSLAVFGQAEYDLSDRFTAIGGLRYGWDRLKLDMTNYSNGTPVFVFNPTTFPQYAKQNSGDWSGKFELDYKPTDDVLIYASVNRGTKAGGFNTQTLFNAEPLDPATAALQAQQTPFHGEVLTSYEGGVKLTLLSGRAHLNVTGFHYDYNGYQAAQPSALSFALKNEQARINGAEVDFDIRPVRGLTLSAFGAYLDATVFNVTLPTAPDTRDRHMPNAPKWTFGGSAAYDIALATGTLTLQGNVKWNSSQYFTIFNEPVSKEAPYAIVDAQVRYAFDTVPVEISLFVNNLTDRRYRLFSVDNSRITGDVGSSFAKPRYYGVSLTYKLGSH